MDFALDALDTVTLSEKGVTFNLKNLDGSPFLNQKKEPVRFIVCGPDSVLHKRIMRENIAIKMERQVEGGAVTDAEIKASDEDAASMLSQMVLGWQGVLDTKNEKIEFSKDTAKALFLRYPVIRDQVDRFISNRSNFTRPASAI